MARRTFGNVRLAPDGKMLRDVSSPGGTVEDTQTLRDTPHKQHKAWLYDEGATTGAAADDTGATTGAAAERRKLNSKAISNVRKKAKNADKSEEPARESLTVRALLAGIHPGPLGVGPERVKAQRALSQEVRRAEHPPEVRDAVNATRRVCRAEQPPEDREAGNAARTANRRANAQVTISVRLHCALLLTTPVRLGVSHIPMLMTHLSFDGPRSFKKRRRVRSTAT